MKEQPIGWFYDNGNEFTQCPKYAESLRAEGIALIAVYGAGPGRRRQLVAYCLAVVAAVSVGLVVVLDNAHKHAQIKTKIVDLALKADTRVPLNYSAGSGDISECIEVLYRLQNQGYTLEARQKAITNLVDITRACDANEQFSIKKNVDLAGSLNPSQS